MESEETPPYRVERAGESYRVADGAGRTVLECRDEANARQYVTLLDQAYRQGYRSGYRAGKSSA